MQPITTDRRTRTMRCKGTANCFLPASASSGKTLACPLALIYLSYLVLIGGAGSASRVPKRGEATFSIHAERHEWLPLMLHYDPVASPSTIRAEHLRQGCSSPYPLSSCPS